MRVIKYINIVDLSIVSASYQLDPTVYKKLIWIDDNGDRQEHPLLSIPSKYWKTVPNDYPEEMNQAEKDVVDAGDLEEYKTEKIGRIKSKSNALYQQGAEHPSVPGTFFFIDTNSKADWNTERNNISEEPDPNDSFPEDYGTTTDEEYEIQDYAEFKDVHKAIRERVKYITKEERKLLRDIRQANSTAEVDAVIDARV